MLCKKHHKLIKPASGTHVAKDENLGQLYQEPLGMLTSKCFHAAFLVKSIILARRKFRKAAKMRCFEAKSHRMM